MEVTNELGVFLSEPYTLKVRDPVLNLEYPKTAMPLGEYLEIIVWSKEINISSTYEWFKDSKDNWPNIRITNYPKFKS